MNVLELGSDRVSLEFSLDELPTILSRLQRRGKVTRRQEATFDVLMVQGEELLLMNEWDEPCLLSKTAAGNAILRSLVHGRARRGGNTGARNVLSA